MSGAPVSVPLSIPRPRRTPRVEVVVGQELEGVGLERLRLLLDDALDLRPAVLVVDVAGSRRLDVAALRVLLQAHTRALHGGGLLSLRSVSAAHSRSIALAGLQGVFSVLDAPAGAPLATAPGAEVTGVAAAP